MHEAHVRAEQVLSIGKDQLAFGLVESVSDQVFWEASKQDTRVQLILTLVMTLGFDDKTRWNTSTIILRTLT